MRNWLYLLAGLALSAAGLCWLGPRSGRTGVEPSRSLPKSQAAGGFFVADFNGDGSEDVAVVASPRSALLSTVNAPLANWTIQDPLGPPGVGAGAKPARPTLRLGDTLLAVVHGAGAGGWRDPEARQAYLLCSGAGRGRVPRRSRELEARPPREPRGL